MNARAREAITRTQPEVVLLAQRDGHTRAELGPLAAELKALGARRVVVLGPVPQWTADLPKVMLRELWETETNRTHRKLVRRLLRTDARLRRDAGQQSGAYTLISAFDTFCNPEGCLTHLDPDDRKTLVTWDYGHLTDVASTFLVRKAVVPLLTAKNEPLSAP